MFMDKNKIILILNPAKANLLKDMGFTSIGKRQAGNSDVFQFIATEQLLAVLNDNTQFSKKDYAFDTKLTF